MQRKLLLVLVSLVLIVSSCASSNIGKHYKGVYTAQENRSYVITRACFIYDSINLSEKDESERFFSEQAMELGLEAIAGETLLPSLRKYTNEEIVNIVHSNDCDSLIICSLQSSETLEQGYSMYNFGYGYPVIVKNDDKKKALLRFVLVEIPSNKIVAVTTVDIVGKSTRTINRIAIVRLLREYKYLGMIK